MSRGSTSLHDPMAGTISSASIAEEDQKNLYAQQELKREQEARRKLEQEAAAKRKAEEEAKRAEAARAAEAARLQAEEEKRAEAARLQAEAQKQQEAQAARAAEAKRVAEEEERKQAEAEREKLAEKARLEAQQRAEHERKAEEQRKAEETRKAEERRLAQAEATREAERKRAEDLAAKKAAEEKAAQEKAAQAKAAAQKAKESTKAKPVAPPLVQTPAAKEQALGNATVGETSFAGMPKPYPATPVLAATKKSSLPIAIAAVLIVLIAGGGVGGYLYIKSRRTTTPPEPPIVKPTDPLDVPVKADLIDIPGGAFKMGRDDGEKTEGPSHQVNVTGFSMDKTEVTNLEYAQFVKQTGHAPPPQWGGSRPMAAEERLPVSNVTFEDANAFAEWRSKRDGVQYRLPTEQEWEYAARNGDQGNLYPWGNNWEAGRAITQESGAVHAEEVGKNQRGADRWGVEDLMGNVYEWTSTRASLYPGNPLKLPDIQKEWIVIRGGGYGTPAAKVNGTYRDWFSPTYKNPLLGFRLVRAHS